MGRVRQPAGREGDGAVWTTFTSPLYNPLQLKRSGQEQMDWSRTVLALAGVVLCGAMAPGCAAASTRQATPQTLPAVLAAARPGDTIELAPGQYANLALVNRRFAPVLTIDARRARIVGAAFKAIDGVTLQGGTYFLPAPRPHPRSGAPAYGSAVRMDGVQNIKIVDAEFIGPAHVEGPLRTPFGEGYGVRVLGVKGLEVTKSRFRGFRAGIAIKSADGFRLADNTFSDMRSDGMDAAESRHGLIEGNECKETRVRDGEHPDCIQLWSRPTSPPTADIVIRRNRIEGGTQGIGLFNHVRKGVDDGGFDRILIEDNEISVSRANGIALYAARDSVVRNNKVRTLRDAKYIAKIKLVGDVKRCGNTVAGALGRPGLEDPPC
jgi:parallel beta-helix repeat protein